VRIAGFAVLLFLTPALYGLGIAITGVEAGIELTPGYNRTYYETLTFATSGSLEFNERYTLRGGFSLWNANSVYEVDAATGLKVQLIRNLPLYVYFSYIFNTLPDYDTHSHTMLPLIGFRGYYAGITLGTNLRYSSFFDEPVIFESILAFDVYVNFYNTERFRIGVGFANFDDYTAGNFGAYYLSLNSTFDFTQFLCLTGSLELHQTGSAGLSSEFYGIGYKMGVVVKW
jgi:hypothetical protein